MWAVPRARPLSVCIAGATGWAGRALVGGVLDAPDLALGSAVSRSAAGRDLGDALGSQALGVRVHGSAADALDGIDVLVDYTSVTVVKENALAAIDAGVAVVIGTSGLTAAMCSAAALLAARHLPQWEIIDYASATKPDVPSGTARARRAARGDPAVGARVPDRRAARSPGGAGARRPHARAGHPSPGGRR